MSEHRKEYAKAYRASEHGREVERLYRRSSKNKEIQKRYQQSIHGRAVGAVYKHDWRTRLRLGLVELLGSSCMYCGYSDDIRALALDHIHDDGYLERKKFKESSSMWSYYLKNPEEARLRLQILCMNCNWIKHCEHLNKLRIEKYSPILGMEGFETNLQSVGDVN